MRPVIRAVPILVLWVAAASPAQDQDALDLSEALDRALERSASMAIAEAAQEASDARRAQARARLLPRIDYTESFSRSDNPVYVFGTLLTQRRFTERNFAIDALNRPDPLSLYQSQFRLQQILFDRESALRVHQASLGAEVAAEARRQAEMGVLFETVRVYYGIHVSARNRDVLRQGVRTAEEDLERARALFDAGQVTEADLLSLRVHLADLREQEIRAGNDVALLRAELNKLMGEPLERDFALTTELDFGRRVELSERESTRLEATAVEERPEARQVALEEESAEVEKKIARSGFLPSVRFDAGWESDRVGFTETGGTNWMLGFSVRVNLFDGLGKLARLREAEAAIRQARARRRETEDSVRLEVRRATLDLEAARERLEVASGSVEQARESRRILQARYESGLANLTDLLRGQNALLGAEARHLGASYEARLAEVRVALVTGTLDRKAEVLEP